MLLFLAFWTPVLALLSPAIAAMLRDKRRQRRKSYTAPLWIPPCRERQRQDAVTVLKINR